MQHIFILNPAAGRVDATLTLAARIHEAFGAEAILHTTSGVGDATAFVKQYAQEHRNEHLRFYACGGDGTFSEVVSGAFGFSHIAVGVVPIGTGNDFVRNFQNNHHFTSMEKQRNGQEISIDLLRCNDRYCVNMLNTGFDCDVVAKMQEIKRHVPANMAYALGVLIELVKKPCADIKVMADGEWVCEGEKLLCAVANGAYYGGGYHPLPDASLRDGYLDVCLVDNVSRRRFISLVGKYKEGKHIMPQTEDIIRVIRCRRLYMEFPASRRVSLDGELIMMDRCEIEVLPAAVSLVMPQGCALTVDANATGKVTT